LVCRAKALHINNKNHTVPYRDQKKAVCLRKHRKKADREELITATTYSDL